MSAWALIGLAVTVYDHLVYYSLTSAGIRNNYNFYSYASLNICVGVLAGLAGGSFLVYYVNGRYRHIAYYQSFLLIFISFIIISSSLIILVSLILSLMDPEPWSWDVMRVFLQDTAHLKNVMIWLTVLLLTQAILQVKDKFGNKVFLDFLIGKYHLPKEEVRIFMFVDLMSSTSIAEKLSNEKYHLMLRDFYADITDSIVSHAGEIYQYVGDEVVITWKYNLNENDRCLKCFFEMTKTIDDRTQRYLSNYGLVPQFKAGIHYGKVTVGEIGVLKRDITFSGDVLNTTSRIQGKCNELKVRILVSDDLISTFPRSDLFKSISLGNVELRGKERHLGVSTILSEYSVD